MSDTKFQLRESVVANFELALRNAGMQRWTGTDPKKPKYWRGRVESSGMVEDLFFLYTVTDNLELEAADNKSFRRQVFINGQLYTRSGFSNANFQDLANAIERECGELGFIFNFEGEGIDTSIDENAPVYYCNFEAEKRVIM